MDSDCERTGVSSGEGGVRVKSLWKIGSRYVCSAVLITVLIVYANLMFFLYYGIKNMNSTNTGNGEIGRELMESVVLELDGVNDKWKLSEMGYTALEESAFVWAMFLDESGDVAWSWQLPAELPKHYSLGDVASFSRWYLLDYPVRTWRSGDKLMVFGMEKDSVTRFSAVYNMDMFRRLPSAVKGFLISNIVLLLVLAVFLAYRFYRSMKPLADGIDCLAHKEVTALREKGIMADLARKLNQASAMLKYQDEKLAQRDEARTNWIAGVSHDIRTPLTLIAGYADELAGKTQLLEEARNKAVIIREQSLIIGQLVADLNLTSKLEYEAQPLNKSDFSPAGLLRTCVAEYYNQGISNLYEIEVDIAGDVEQIHLNGDTGLLLRAFRNLIGNSIRHNEDGCVVFIKLIRWEEGVRFVFADTGVGIPKRIVCELEEKNTDVVAQNGISEKRKNIDNPVQKPAEQPVHIMGLRIVCQIIKAHGWKIEFVKRECGTYDVEIRVGR